MVLAAAQNGDLIAFAAHADGGKILWQFHTGGTIYSPPTVDLATGRIYFGSSNKRLYALDINGFYRWSFPTGDNIATRPLVTKSLIVFGSEDGSVYALDREIGSAALGLSYRCGRCLFTHVAGRGFRRTDCHRI